MNWTILWFMTNLVFVAAFIAYLFMHRSYTAAKMEGADAGRLLQLKRRSNWVGIVAIIFFIAMIASFVTNMKLKG